MIRWGLIIAIALGVLIGIYAGSYLEAGPARTDIPLLHDARPYLGYW